MNKRYYSLMNTGWLRHRTPKVCPPYNAFNVFSQAVTTPGQIMGKKKTTNQQLSAIASANSPL